MIDPNAIWAQRQLGLRLDDTADERDERLADLVGLGVRRNPLRAHLLVSSVLGKHVPADPRTVLGAGSRLAARTAPRLESPAAALVLGYAETATGLGHAVAAGLGAYAMHSTRRSVPGAPVVAGFEEEHSHARGHLLLPEDPDVVRWDGPVVLVDDELSTGRTVLNTIAALQRVHGRSQYVVAALVDVRGVEERASFDTRAAELGVRIDVVSLARGRLVAAHDAAYRAARLMAEATVPQPLRPVPDAAPWGVSGWPRGVREGGRHGFSPADDRAARDAARACAAPLAQQVSGRDVLVLGTEELMYVPTLLAEALRARLGNGHSVRVSSTTRSPVAAFDDVSYPIRTALTFHSTDPTVDGPGPRFAYNVAPARGGASFSDVVVVIDDAADSPALHAPDGLLAQVAGVCTRVHVLTVPTYRPAGWAP